MNLNIGNTHGIDFLPFDFKMIYTMAKYVQENKLDYDKFVGSYDLSDAGGPVISVVMRDAELCPKPKGVPVDQIPEALHIDNGYQTVEVLLFGDDLHVAVSPRKLGHRYFDAEDVLHGLANFIRETEDGQVPPVRYVSPT